MARLAIVLLHAALAAALVLPAAAAHTTVETEDGQYRIVVGQLDEPVITHAKTGLDLCFSLNTTARTPVTIDPFDFEEPAGFVKLVAPGGDELAMPLRAQFGRDGCYQFTEPYVLTEPGQYTVSLMGSINGTAVEVSAANAGGAVVDQDEILFPAGADAGGGADDERGAPMPAAAWLAVGLAAFAAIRRLR